MSAARRSAVVSWTDDVVKEGSDVTEPRERRRLGAGGMMRLAKGRGRRRATVCVLDAQRIRAGALAAILEDLPEVSAVSVLDGSPEQFCRVLELAPDLVVIAADDERRAAATVRALRAAAPAAATAVLVDASGPEAGMEAARAGARGVLSRDAGVEEVRWMVNMLLQGGAALPPELLRRVMEDFRLFAPEQVQPALSLGGLTKRERSVLLMVGAGRSNTEIAEALGYGLSTVKADLRAVLEKLGLRGRGQAAAYVGLLSAQRSAAVPGPTPVRRRRAERVAIAS